MSRCDYPDCVFPDCLKTSFNVYAGHYYGPLIQRTHPIHKKQHTTVAEVWGALCGELFTRLDRCCCTQRLGSRFICVQGSSTDVYNDDDCSSTSKGVWSLSVRHTSTQATRKQSLPLKAAWPFCSSQAASSRPQYPIDPTAPLSTWLSCVSSWLPQGE